MPAAQEEQTDEPAAANEPAGQVLHVEFPNGLEVPAAHGTHVYVFALSAVPGLQHPARPAVAVALGVAWGTVALSSQLEVAGFQTHDLQALTLAHIREQSVTTPLGITSGLYVGRLLRGRS